MSNTLVSKFQAVEQALSDRYLERVKESRCAVLAILSGKHMFIVGPPGTAKTALIRDLSKMVALDDEEYFPWLMTKYTTPEEIFGPPSFEGLKAGRMERMTAHKLPRAKIALLDEIFKGSSSINNTLLTIMNERVFYNGEDTDEVPLSSLFALSNELADDEALSAIWDRLLLRFQVDHLRERSNFEALLIAAANREEPQAIVDWSEVEEAQEQVRKVTMPDNVFAAMVGLRESLQAQGVRPSDRRWVECLPVIRAEAWLSGRDKVTIRDLRILQHVLWDRPDDIHPVQKVVLEVADPLEKRVVELLRDISDQEDSFENARVDTDDPRALARESVEIKHKLDKIRDEIKEIKKTDGADEIDLLPTLEGRFRHVAARLVTEGFGIRNVKNAGMET